MTCFFYRDRKSSTKIHICIRYIILFSSYINFWILSYENTKGIWLSYLLSFCINNLKSLNYVFAEEIKMSKSCFLVQWSFSVTIFLAGTFQCFYFLSRFNLSCSFYFSICTLSLLFAMLAMVVQKFA